MHYPKHAIDWLHPLSMRIATLGCESDMFCFESLERRSTLDTDISHGPILTEYNQWLAVWRIIRAKECQSIAFSFRRYAE